MALSVLIIDDERWMRETIEKSVEWEAHDLKVIGKASDGVEGYHLITELKPDIVLADIRMPEMDGIDLLKSLKENSPVPLFIFFSGFDRFEYAKDAINLGAIGYLLKPVDEKELLAALLKAKEIKEGELQKCQEKIKLAGLAEKEKDHKKLEFINQMFNGTGVERTELENAGLYFLFNSFIVASLEIDRYAEIEKEGHKEKEIKVKQALAALCIEYLSCDGVKAYSTVSQKGVELLINLQNDRVPKVREICKAIINAFKTGVGYSVTIGLGLEVDSAERIKDSFKMSKKALENKLLQGEGKTIEYNEKMAGKVIHVILDGRMEKEIAEAFEKSDFTLSQKLSSSILLLIGNDKICTDDIKRFNYSFIELVYRLITRFGVSTEGICTNPHILYDDMNRCQSIEELFRMYTVLINESLQMVSDRSLNYYKKLADNVKKYIHEHYYEEISLESVAQALAFHPNYVSRVFKEEFGETFIDYLTNHRINVAKELLLDNIRHNVLDVAAMVGYNNPKYFSKVFKKVVGVTPVEFIGKKQV